MADTAVHLCEDVLPQVPIRQSVLSLPFRIRYLLAYDAKLCAAVRRIFVRTLLVWSRERAASAGIAGGRSGAVVLAQRFGGALNLNLHFHALVLDGAFTSQKPLAPPDFPEAPPLLDQDVVAVTTLLHRRILRYLRRLGRLQRDEQDESSAAEPDEPMFAELCAGLRAPKLEIRSGRALDDDAIAVPDCRRASERAHAEAACEYVPNEQGQPCDPGGLAHHALSSLLSLSCA